jgi:hypothetical protein
MHLFVAYTISCFLGLPFLSTPVGAMEIAAELTVEVTIGSVARDAPGEIRLHFSSDHFVALSRRSSTHFSFSGSDSGDHPFVGHPDEWDNLYLAMSKRLKRADIERVYIKYEVISYMTSASTHSPNHSL